MRTRWFLGGTLLGAAVLALAVAAAPVSGAERDGSCEEYGNFVCCCTETDCECIEVTPLQPAG